MKNFFKQFEEVFGEKELKMLRDIINEVEGTVKDIESDMSLHINQKPKPCGKTKVNSNREELCSETHSLEEINKKERQHEMLDKVTCYVSQLTGDEHVWAAFQATTEKEVSLEQNQNVVYGMEHSPLRMMEFWVELYDIPVFVMNQLTRHHIGVDHYVLSKREDRTNSIDEGRWTPTNYSFKINAQALINISRQRLCKRASDATQEVWDIVLAAISEINPKITSFCVPNCVYRGGICKSYKNDGKGACGMKPEVLKEYSYYAALNK